MSSAPGPRATFDDLVEVVKRLRDPGGCPWDRQQTHESLRPHLLEECYELLESIDANDAEGMAEELGDLLVQIVFHADMGRRHSEFTATDVVAGARNKLIRRHPHVFGDGQKLDSADQVAARWEDIKRKERGPNYKKVADALPAAMPALAYAANLQQRAERSGIPWRQYRPEEPDANGRERELGTPEVSAKQRERAAGELLFDLVAKIRDAGIDPETALRVAAVDFRERVRRTEEAAGQTPLSSLDQEERSRLWMNAAAEETMP